MGNTQAAKTTQFFFEGRARFNRNGYLNALQEQPERFKQVDTANLSNRVYMVTGANSGIGKEVTRYLAQQGAEKVFMVCRSSQRGADAKNAIIEEISKSGQSSARQADAGELQKVLEVVEADCGVRASLDQAFDRLSLKKLDGLVCNAGILEWQPNFTPEGYETTLATHLVFGVYHVANLALPALRNTVDSRVVFVSSGGMYNCKWPGFRQLVEKPADVGKKDFDGQLQYAYAKRGQVILAEELAKENRNPKFVSCHPGWSDTVAVRQAYGSSAALMEPMRNAWEGAKGICWLLAAKATDLESGGFYLDCATQTKHLDGMLSSKEHTQNSKDEVADFMKGLAKRTSSSGRISTSSTT
ncbi:unnamed protein product [Amoebophrya sp. A120]|nr:unnamed protein product [Amoebophrya sp. A120]|eukprot:GSA120T00005674001.1